MQKSKKILIVDDEPRNQRIISEVLEDFFELKIASSGEEALALNESHVPDLILLDIMMPGIDGYEVCSKIKNDPRFLLTKIILLSGKAMIDERLKGYEVGADDYMTKPFSSEELLAKTKVFLHLHTIESELARLNHSLENQVKERTQKLLEAEARLINAMKLADLGEMAGGIAHEINTPLGIISLIVGRIAKILKQTPIDQNKIIEILSIVDKTVQRINTIIVGLKSFSKDVNNEDFVTVSLQSIIEDTINLCGDKLKQNNIQLLLEPISKDLLIQCRAVQISQVLINLLNNSCDALWSNPTKWIQISVERTQGKVKILITDSGSGLPESIVDKVFQPFYTTKEIGKGTGLGLSISKGIMETHSGSLSVDKDCKNTRFILSLPDNAGREKQEPQKSRISNAA